MNGRIKARFCRAFFCLSLLLLFGIAGGIERGYCPLGRGVLLAVICLFISLITGLKGGLFRA